MTDKGAYYILSTRFFHGSAKYHTCPDAKGLFGFNDFVFFQILIKQTKVDITFTIVHINYVHKKTVAALLEDKPILACFSRKSFVLIVVLYIYIYIYMYILSTVTKRLKKLVYIYLKLFKNFIQNASLNDSFSCFNACRCKVMQFSFQVFYQTSCLD